MEELDLFLSCKKKDLKEFIYSKINIWIDLETDLSNLMLQTNTNLKSEIDKDFLLQIRRGLYYKLEASFPHPFLHVTREFINDENEMRIRYNKVFEEFDNKYSLTIEEDKVKYFKLINSGLGLSVSEYYRYYR